MTKERGGKSKSKIKKNQKLLGQTQLIKAKQIILE